MTTRVNADTYSSAEGLLPARAEELIVGGEVVPHFIAGTDRFWFRDRSLERERFAVVDPARAIVEQAFDHERMAAALTEASGRPSSSEQLPFRHIELDFEGRLLFAAHGRQWRFDHMDGRCLDVGDAELWAGRSISPDGRWAVARQDFDVVLFDLSSGGEHRLTSDGSKERRYGTRLDWWTFFTTRRGGIALRPLVVWSPDSTRFAVERIDESRVAFSYLVDTAHNRPRLHAYRYPLPGDEQLPLSELFVVSVADRQLTPVALEPTPLGLDSMIAGRRVWWSNDSTRVELVQQGREHRDARLVSVDPETGTAETLVEERDELPVETTHHFRERPNARVLAGSRAIWFSERDGWGHLWLVDRGSWTQLTSGSWLVRQLLHVDEVAGEVFFTGSGREPGSHPYHRHLYRVGLDGGEPERLTPEDADHEVTFAPSGRYFVDCSSRVDDPPRASLRGSDGGGVADLGRADITRLIAAGWTPPVPFTITAADGKTDVYGILYRPREIAENAHLPLVDCVYPGPQIIVSKHRFGLSESHCEAISALGFAVITVDGRGTPFRSRAFHTASYRELETTQGLADHVAAIRQLAQRYAWIDADRVGIVGASGGGYAAARALLTHPDVYHVAVASHGNHDNLRYLAGWGEHYIGLPHDQPDAWERQSSIPHAEKLRGKLLLAFGGLDDNVQPWISHALVRALIAANKDPDLLLLPDDGHDWYVSKGYFTRRCWDYLVEHLLGKQPPPYEISPDSIPDSDYWVV